MEKKDNEFGFGDYIKQLRKSRELTLQQAADYLNTVKSYISAVESKRKAPFTDEKMNLFIEFLELTEDETAILYDLAGKYKYKSNVSFNIKGVSINEEVDKLALTALRISKDVPEAEAKWKTIIRQFEEEKAKKANETNDGSESE